MNDFSNTSNGSYNLKQSYPDVGKVLRDRRTKLVEAKKPEVIKDQVNQETAVSRGLFK